MTTLMQPSHTYQAVLPEYKVVVLGEGGVGKSSLTVRLCSDNFIDEYDPTVEDCYRKKANIDGQEVLLEITDTAGQEEFQGMRDEWIRDGDGYLLVYSINLPNSFENLYTIRDKILQTLDCEDAPIVIAGNKCDLEDERRVSQEELEKLAKEWDCPAFETSAKTKINNVKVFHETVKEIIKYQQKKNNPDGQTENEKETNCNFQECCTIL